MRSILLNPGSVSLSEKVRKAAVSTDLCHREPEYSALQDRVRNGLADVYGCDPSLWTAVLLGGSGTMALEAMLSSLLPREARMMPRTAPCRPTVRTLQAHGRAYPPNFLHESWRDFLYWDSELEAV